MPFSQKTLSVIKRTKENCSRWQPQKGNSNCVSTTENNRPSWKTCFLHRNNYIENGTNIMTMDEELRKQDSSERKKHKSIMLCGWTRRRTESLWEEAQRERWCRNVCQWVAHSPTVPTRWHLTTFPLRRAFLSRRLGPSRIERYSQQRCRFCNCFESMNRSNQHNRLIGTWFSTFLFFANISASLSIHVHGNESEHLSLIEAGAFRFLKAVRVDACVISIGYGLLAFFHGWILFRWNANAFAENEKFKNTLSTFCMFELSSFKNMNYFEA